MHPFSSVAIIILPGVDGHPRTEGMPWGVHRTAIELRALAPPPTPQEGTFELVLDGYNAPVSAGNFMDLVENGAFLKAQSTPTPKGEVPSLAASRELIPRPFFTKDPGGEGVLQRHEDPAGGWLRRASQGPACSCPFPKDPWRMCGPLMGQRAPVFVSPWLNNLGPSLYFPNCREISPDDGATLAGLGLG